MTAEQRNDIVNYRIENAEGTLKEVLAHCESGYFNTESTDCIMRASMQQLHSWWQIALKPNLMTEFVRCLEGNLF